LKLQLSVLIDFLKNERKTQILYKGTL